MIRVLSGKHTESKRNSLLTSTSSKREGNADKLVERKGKDKYIYKRKKHTQTKFEVLVVMSWIVDFIAVMM